MDNIKISVIMPIYNAGEYLSRAIGDLLSQSFTDIELICVDDGSTDNSDTIIRSFMRKDSRVKMITQRNGGPSIARNAGLAEAVGDYIIFLDADDFYEKNLLSSLYEVAERDNLDVAVARFDIYNDNQNKYTTPMEEPHSGIFVPGGVTSKNEHPDFILSSTTGYVWNKLFRASFIRNMEISFDPELYVFEDVYFVCSALALAQDLHVAGGVSGAGVLLVPLPGDVGPLGEELAAGLEVAEPEVVGAPFLTHGRPPP
jgi:glycosyltransferase involved in cell wall biosynthesis